MKAIALLIFGLFMNVSFADTSAIETLLIDGQDQYYSMNLSTEKTRTEYETVTYPSTCYRTEYRYRCHRNPPICRRVCDRRGLCRNQCSGGGRVCRNVPVTVSYPCTRTERRAVQVHDYDVETNVEYQIQTTDADATIAEEFTMKVVGDTPTLTVKGSKNYFIILKKLNEKERMEAGVKYIDRIYQIELKSATKAKRVLASGIENVSYKNGIYSYTLGQGFNLSEFTQRVRVYKYRFIGSDSLLIDKNLDGNEIEINSTNGISEMNIDLNNLEINIPSKVRVILDTTYNIDEETLLNKGEIEISTYANWIFK